MSAFGGNSLQRNAMMHKWSFIVIDDNLRLFLKVILMCKEQEHKRFSVCLFFVMAVKKFSAYFHNRAIEFARVIFLALAGNLIPGWTYMFTNTSGVF